MAQTREIEAARAAPTRHRARHRVAWTAVAALALAGPATLVACNGYERDPYSDYGSGYDAGTYRYDAGATASHDVTLALDAPTIFVRTARSSTMGFTVVRSDGYTGPVEVELRGYGNLATTRSTVPAGASRGEIVVAAGASPATISADVVVKSPRPTRYQPARLEVRIRKQGGTVVESSWEQSPSFPQAASDVPRGAVVRSDGRTITLATTSNGSFSTLASLSLTQHDANGARDMTFGVDGVARIDLSGLDSWPAPTMALQADGKILVAATRRDSAANAQGVVVRCLPDGRRDDAFGTAGTFVLPRSGNGSSRVNDIAVTIAGRVLVVGTNLMPNQMSAVARLVTDGASGTALDDTFGTGGMAPVGDASFFATDLEVLAGDSMVIAGTASRYESNGATSTGFGARRLTADGTADLGFGASGLALVPLIGTRSFSVTGVHAAPDGSLVIAGSASRTTTTLASRPLVARLTSNGAIDEAFGEAGVVPVDLTPTSDEPLSGFFVGAGNTVTTLATGPSGVFEIVRLRSDGVRDATFGTGGAWTSRAGCGAAIPSLLAQRPNGGALVGASCSRSTGGDYELALVAMTASGAPDLVFGSGGVSRLALWTPHDDLVGVAFGLNHRVVYGGTSRAEGTAVAPLFVRGSTSYLRLTRHIDRGAPLGTIPDGVGGVALQADGKLVIAGTRGASGHRAALVSRQLTTGALDVAFGAGGTAYVALGDDVDVHGVIVQPDGAIVVVATITRSITRSMAVLRFDSQGVPDLSFGAAGVAEVSFGGNGDTAGAIALQKDGRIVFAGTADDGSGQRFAVARLQSDGTPDPSFGAGKNGRVATAAPGPHSRAHGIALDAKGNVIVVGQRSNGRDDDFAVMRFDPNGAPDTSFGGTGAVTLGIGGDDDVARAVVVDVDGGLLIAGSSMGSTTGNDFAVARLLASGALDEDFGTKGRVTIAGPGNDVARALGFASDGSVFVAGARGEGPTMRDGSRFASVVLSP